ncbi:MAG: DUF4476 domain-containing protein [Bacteroidales bacterium]|nr:DUF4476 domain-containing protein [Bacteroidales bacterium]
MKNLIITLVLLGAVFAPKSSEAQRYSSELILKMYDNSIYTVIFDRKIYDLSGSQFRLSNINPGSHRLVVKQRIGGRYGALRIIYNGNIDIPQHSIVRARINKYNRMVISSVTPIRSNYSDNNNYRDNNRHGYYNRPLLDLGRLQRSLNNASFESDKRMIAEQAISSHRVKAEQVYRILLMFSFESTKLKVAKFAYNYCVDKRNYYRVNDAFTFSSSIRELNNYIGNSKSDYYDDDWGNYNNNYNNNNNNYNRW